MLLKLGEREEPTEARLLRCGIIHIFSLKNKKIIKNLVERSE